MGNKSNHDEVALHTKWEKNPKSYVKPPNPTGERNSRLMHAPSCHTSLGYILFVNNQRVITMDAAATEFLFDDPDIFRKETLHMKSKAGFHVYYKNGPYWYGVSTHFDNLAQAIPYLQGGNRVIVEYRTK